MSDDLVKRMNDARDFPANTCGASRHAAMIAEALCKQEDYPMLAEEPEHCGGSIAATVAMLWECRAKLAKAVDTLQNVNECMFSAALGEYELTSHIEGALERKNARVFLFRQARTALAELKGEDRG